jgi:hypothetical protein
MGETRSNRWTPREDDLFRRMAETNIRPELIAAKLNRSVHAIKAHAYTIGLPLKWFKPKGEGKMTRNRSLLLGIGIGLFGALAILTARYVAVVLAG